MSSSSSGESGIVYGYQDESPYETGSDEEVMLHEPTPDFFTARMAIESGEVEKFQSVYKEDLFFQAHDSITLLEMAASNDQAKIVKCMLKIAMSDKKLDIFRKALDVAIKENRPEVVGAFMRNMGPFGNSQLATEALVLAGRLGLVEVVQAILDAGAWIRIVDADTDELVIIAEYGQTAVV